MFLVIGPLASLGGSWLASFSPSSKRFILKSASSNGERSATLKVELTLYSPGKSILQALLLIFSTTRNGLSPHGCNLFFLCKGNLSFRKCTQTQSPLRNWMSFLP